MARRERLLDALLGSGSSPNIRWRDLIALLRSAGARIHEGRGSTISVALRDERAYVAVSHPNLRADRGAIDTVRALFKRAGLAS